MVEQIALSTNKIQVLMTFISKNFWKQLFETALESSNDWRLS